MTMRRSVRTTTNSRLDHFEREPTREGKRRNLSACCAKRASVSGRKVGIATFWIMSELVSSGHGTKKNASGRGSVGAGGQLVEGATGGKRSLWKIQESKLPDQTRRPCRQRNIWRRTGTRSLECCAICRGWLLTDGEMTAVQPRPTREFNCNAATRITLETEELPATQFQA